MCSRLPVCLLTPLPASALARSRTLLPPPPLLLVLLLLLVLRRREKFCDFCKCELPDWKSVLTPTLGSTAPAVMNVNFDNKTYSFHVAPGARLQQQQQQLHTQT